MISFDKSIYLKDVWVTAAELQKFNEMRQEMAKKQIKPRVSVDVDNTVTSEINTSQNIFSVPENEHEISINYISK